jgi:aspartate/glutamate racemase
MKTIGMLGGMSWESTASYYKAINQGVKNALGGLHSAKICLYSVDFDEIEKLQHQGTEAIILGCTEIALLIQQQHTQIPLYDTTEIHANQAVKAALSN